MQRLYNNSATMFLLRSGINKGYWTLEDLDVPPPGYIGDPESYVNLLRTDPEPAERVEVVSPRDLTPPPDPAPLEPNVELDGVTLITNADPTDLSDLPF